MIVYVRTCLTSAPRNRTLWAMGFALATLSSLPVALGATFMAPSAAALLFTGDVALAADLAPGAAGMPGGVWAAALAGLAIGWLLWTRAYTVAVWASNDATDGGLRTSLRATRGAWRTVGVLYLHYGLATAGVFALALAPGLTGDGGGASPTIGLLVVAFGMRTVMRILLTVGTRAAVLEGFGTRASWRKAWRLVRERRGNVAAAWVTLVALGLTVWIGGRVLSPVLQDTALEYPGASTYALARETGQLLVAIPLESFLLVVALTGWSAVYLKRDEPEPAPSNAPRPRPSQTDPWIVRGLVGLLVLAIAGNGVPSAVDAAWAQDQEDRLAGIARSEISPGEALSPSAAGSASAPTGLTRYRVDARLDEDRLSWTTHIDYVNNTKETLDDIGLHLYPAAYTEQIEDVPLADTLFDADLTGTFRAQARSGTFGVRGVEVDGRRARWTREATALTVALPRPLRPHGSAGLVIRLEARLPHWPERYGVWDERTLLGNWIPTAAVREHGEWRLDGFSEVGDPFYSEVANYRVDLAIDDALTAVGSGHLTGIAPGGRRGRRVWSFTSRATRDAAFAVSASFQGLEQRVGDTLVRSWYRADERDRGASNLRAAVDAIRDFRRRFGPLPQDEVEVVETGGFLGGMEYPGVIFTSDSSGALAGVPLLADLFRYVGFSAAQERYVIGHEVAHQWWYAAVGNDQIEEPWLDEAFAEVSTRLWLRGADGDDRVFRLVNGTTDVRPRPGVLSAGVDDFESNSAYTKTVYLSGANVLLELRDRLGTATWNEVMRSWYRRKTFGIGTVEEFIEGVADIAGLQAARAIRYYL